MKNKINNGGAAIRRPAKFKTIFALSMLFLISVTAFFGVTFTDKTVKAASSLVTNGDFSNGVTDWSIDSGVSYSLLDKNAAGAQNGKALEVKRAGGKTAAKIRHTALTETLYAGKTYNFSFRYRTDLLGNIGDLGSVYFTAGGEKVGNVEVEIYATNSVWQTAYLDIVPYSNAENAVLEIEFANIDASKAATVSYCFADFSLTEQLSVIKNGNFSDGLSGWTFAKKNDSVVNIEAGSKYADISVVNSAEYGGEYGNAIKIYRPSLPTGETTYYKDGYIDIRATRQETLTEGFNYRLSFYAYNDMPASSGSADGVFYGVFRDSVGGNIICNSAGLDGTWKYFSYEFICTEANKTPSFNYRIMNATSAHTVDGITLLLADVRIEKLSKLTSIDLTNGDFSKKVGDYPAEWGILGGKTTISGGAATVANNAAEESFGLSFFSSVYEGGQYKLSASIKAKGDEMKSAFKIYVTPYSDIKRTVAGDRYELDVEWKTGLSKNLFNTYTFDLAINKGIAYLDISFVGETTANLEFSLKDVSFKVTGNNLDFEMGEDKPIFWSATAGTLTSEKGARTGGSGTRYAKVSGVNGGRLNSSNIPLCGGGYYELSFYIKTKLDFSAYVAPFVKFYTADGKSAKFVIYGGNANPGDGLNPYTQRTDTVWQTYFNYVSGETKDWQNVRIPFRAPEDAAYCVLSFGATGSGEWYAVDDVRFTEVAQDESVDIAKVLDFEEFDEENNPAYWYMTVGREKDPQVKVVSDVYHSGKHSLYINANTLNKSQYLYNSLLIPVTPTGSVNVYEASFWVSSRNADVKSVELDVWFYGKDGVKLFSSTIGHFEPHYGGTIKTLNSSSERGEWSKVITRVPIESTYTDMEIKYVSLAFAFTTGKAEVWLDDILFRQVEADSADIFGDGVNYKVIADFNDVHAVDESGNIAGFTAVDDNLNSVDGCLTHGETEEDGGFVTLAANTGAKLRFRTATTFTGYKYSLVVRYKSAYHVNVQARFYDYMGRENSERRLTETFTATADGYKYEIFVYTAPSATYTDFLFDNGEQGELSVSNVALWQTGAPSTAGNWKGYWLNYRADTRNSEEFAFTYYRKKVTLDETKKIVYAPLQFTGDDKIGLWVNGELVVDKTSDAGQAWSNILVEDIAKYLVNGENTLAFAVYNEGAYSGLLFDGIWKYDDGEQIEVYSDGSVIWSKSVTDGDEWTKPEYDDGAWRKAVVLGAPPMDPWGSVYYDSSLYVDNRIEINVIDGENKFVGDLVFDFTLDIKPEKQLGADFPLTMNLWLKNSTKSICKVTPQILENGDMTSWKVGEFNRVKFRVKLPDYLDTDGYSLQLLTTYFVITNSDVFENRFINFRVENNYVPHENETKIENVNGTPTYIVNGEPKSMFWYIASPRSFDTSLSEADRLSVETLVNFNTGFGSFEGDPDLWKENDTLDFETFDSIVNSMVAASSNANIVLTLNLYPPKWWLAKYPEERALYSDDNGNLAYSASKGVSFGSVKWRDTCVELIKRLIAHMREQKYYGKIAGFRMAAGDTAEFITYYATEDGKQFDYSPAMRDYFAAWAEKEYGTIDALNAAWKSELKSFDEIELPTVAELKQSGVYGAMRDPATAQKKVIDFCRVIGVSTVDCMTTWAKAIKEASDYKLIVGCYYGYLWNTTGLGVAASDVKDAFSSEYMDFFFSPAGYNERQLGESAYMQAVADSIRAYGKMFIAEQDNRTCLSGQYAGTKWNTVRDKSVGITHTFEDTAHQLKRDSAFNICNGNGQWFYDMLGGWHNDEQIQDLMRDVNDEFNFTNYLEKSVINDIAIICNDETQYYKRANSPADIAKGDYAASMNAVIQEYTFKQQRKHLYKSGAGFDVYAMSTLEDGLMPEHKINIFLTPYIVTTKQRAAIDKYCKKNGQINVFLHVAGLGDENELNPSKIRDLTGFDVAVDSSKTSAGQITVTDGTSDITDGLKGLNFGTFMSTINYIRYEVSINADENTEVLGVLSDSGKVGFARKEMDGWTSIYCVAPNLPVEIYRQLIESAGIHVYSRNKADIVWSNSAYVGLHSAESGNKTIYLDGYYSVYDVFEKRYVSMNTNVIEFYHETNDTHLFQLGEANKTYLLARVSGGHGSIGKSGMFKLDGGESFGFDITPDEGYVVDTVTVNGKEYEVGDDLTFALENVTDRTAVVVKFKRKPVEEYREIWETVVKSFTIPAWGMILIFAGVAAVVVGIVVIKNKIQKRRSGV